MLLLTKVRCLASLVAVFSLLQPHVGAQDPDRTVDAPVGSPAVYKTVDGRPLHVYISSPKNTSGALHPAIVFFHGGGWTSGTISQFNMQSSALVERGMVAVNVEYRLVAPAPSLESPRICLEDAKSAIRWVRAHAKELHIDPEKIVGAGGSAGGYLATAAAMVPGWDAAGDDLSVSPKPNVLVLFFPVVDISPSGYGQKRFGEEYAKYAPASYLGPAPPPTIIFGGEADKLVKPETLKNFKQMDEKAGGRCELLFYANQGHGFANNEPYRTMTLAAAEKFLESLGYLTPATK